MSTSETNDQYRIDPDQCAWRIVDGEAVLINSETTFYYGLNASATELWRQLLERDVTPTVLAEALAKPLGVDVLQLSTEVSSFLDELESEGLVSRVRSGTNPTTGIAPVEFDGTWTSPEVTRYNTLEDLILCGE